MSRRFPRGDRPKGTSRFDPYGSRSGSSSNAPKEPVYTKPPWPRPNPINLGGITKDSYNQLTSDITDNFYKKLDANRIGDMHGRAQYDSQEQQKRAQLASWQNIITPGQRPPGQIGYPNVPMDEDMAQRYRTEDIPTTMNYLNRNPVPPDAQTFQNDLDQLQLTVSQWEQYHAEFLENLDTHEKAHTAWPVYDEVVSKRYNPAQMPDWNTWEGERSAKIFRYGSDNPEGQPRNVDVPGMNPILDQWDAQMARGEQPTLPGAPSAPMPGLGSSANQPQQPGGGLSASQTQQPGAGRGVSPAQPPGRGRGANPAQPPGRGRG